MNTDLYTKTILTVIAGCLVYFVLKDTPAMSEARAGAGPIDVNIVQISGTSVGIHPLRNFGDSLPNSGLPPQSQKKWA